MNKTSLINEAASSPLAKAVFLAWAMRQRTRHEVVLSSLVKKMRLEGFHYTKAEYGAFLTKLATMGIGTLKKANGRIVGLFDVKQGVQAVGLMACGEGPKETKPEPPKLKLIIDMHGKQIQVLLPKNLTREDLFSIVKPFTL